MIVLLQFFRTRSSFTESRPDAVSVLFAFLALCALYRAERARSMWWAILGGAGVVIAFGFKQPAAAVAIVPALVLLRRRPWSPAPCFLRALIAPVMLLLTLLALWCFWPQAYFYMIEIPRRFELRPERWHLHFLNILTFNALFVLALGIWLRDRDALNDEGCDKVRWVLVTCAVMAVACTVVVAKRGGSTNSYLPVFLAMTAFVVIMLPRLLGVLTAQGPLARRVLGALLLGLLSAADLIAVPNTELLPNLANWRADAGYARVLERVRALRGTVISPEDPTIGLFAKGYAGRSLHSELDTTGNRFMPESLRRELEAADWLVRVHSTWEFRDERWAPEALGYRRVDDPAFKDIRRYSLWSRKTPAELMHHPIVPEYIPGR